MNNCVISGNMVKDVEVKYTQSGMAIARFTVAVQRKFKNKETGKYDSDFINCLAFDSRATTIAQYFKKGSKVLFQGSWQTGSYEKNDGTKVYTNELLVENFDFIGGNSGGQGNSNNTAKNNSNDFNFGDPDFSYDSIPF